MTLDLASGQHTPGVKSAEVRKLELVLVVNKLVEFEVADAHLKFIERKKEREKKVSKSAQVWAWAGKRPDQDLGPNLI